MTETMKPTTERTAAVANGFRTIGTGAPAAVSEPVGTDDRAVIGVFDDIDAAQAAVERLAAAGFPIDRISIVSKDLQSETRVNGYVTTGDIAGPAAATGAWVGGLFGLMAGSALLFVFPLREVVLLPVSIEDCSRLISVVKDVGGLVRAGT